MDKQNARKFIKNMKADLSVGEVLTYSTALSNEFIKTDIYKNASVIYSYLPYNTEIITDLIIEAAWRDGKTVGVPKVLGEREMEFFKITSFDNIDFGYCKIPEPCGDEPVLHEKEVLMILPGLAFDKNKNRLGYGGGFYDSYIEKEEAAGTHFIKVSLAYPFQVLDEIETLPHDKKVDYIVTRDTII